MCRRDKKTIIYINQRPLYVYHHYLQPFTFWDYIHVYIDTQITGLSFLQWQEGALSYHYYCYVYYFFQYY